MSRKSKKKNVLLDFQPVYWFTKCLSDDQVVAVDYESHQRILFLFSRALINRDLVTGFVMNAIIIIVPSYIMRGYLGGIIYGDRSCCLMHQASWANESAITYTRGSAVCSDVEILFGKFFCYQYGETLLSILHSLNSKRQMRSKIIVIRFEEL